MTWLQVHTACSVLVVLDLLARTTRIRTYVAGVGHRLGFIDAFVLTAFGDGTAAITPLRSGGHPARLTGLYQAGIPFGRTVNVLAVDTGGHHILVALTGAALICLVPVWWRNITAQSPLLSRDLLAWLGAGFLLVALLAGIARRRTARHAPRSLPPASSTRAGIGRHQIWSALFGVPLTLLSIACRVAMLPILALALPNPPSAVALVFGSFLLIYGQLLVPIPAGLGAVELGLAGGIAGSFGPDTARILFAWRLYSTIIPVAVGLGLGLLKYGPNMIRRALQTGKPVDRGGVS